MERTPKGYAICKRCRTNFKHNWKDKSRLCPTCKAIEEENLEYRRNIQREFAQKRMERVRAANIDDDIPLPSPITKKRGRPKKVKEIASAQEFVTADLTSRAALANRCGMSYGKLCAYVQSWGELPPIKKNHE